jgi:hypothetical protein
MVSGAPWKPQKMEKKNAITNSLMERDK